MDITQDRMNGILILRVSGRLNVATWKTFEEKLLATIDAGEKRLVVDLSQVDHISSLGLQVFLLAAKRMGREGGNMVLCALKDHVKEIFEIAGFSSILSIYDSRDEAVKSL